MKTIAKKISAKPLYIKVLIIIFLFLFPLTIRVTAQAQTDPTPVPLAVKVTEDKFKVDFSTEPDPLLIGRDFSANIKIDWTAPTQCFGVPGAPVDLFFVIDNSGSAGNGSPGSNLAKTRALLDDFIVQSDQGIYIDPDYNDLEIYRSRYGLITTMVTTSGPEINSTPLSEDPALIRQAIADISVGADTELAEGIREAQKQLSDDKRDEAIPIIVLVLHDKLPIQQAIPSALEAKRDGIQLYILNNTFQISSEDEITAQDAQRIADGDQMITDPDSQELRQAFIRMSQGTLEPVIKNLYVANRWTPDDPSFLEVTNVQGSGATQENRIVWRVDQLGEDDVAEFSYQGEINDTAPPKADSTVDLAYIDCNGFFQYQSYPFSVGLVAASPEPELTEEPEGESSEIVYPTKTPLTTVLPPETGGSQPPQGGLQVGGSGLDLSGPFAALEGLSSLGASLAALPNLLQWLFLLLLLVLLVLLILWLISLLKKRKPGQKPAPTPRPNSGGSLSVNAITPAWITRLTEENVLVQHEQSAEGIEPLRDTLLIGLGPAGREVLSQIADVLNMRFGKKWPANLRMLQIDVQPHSDPSVITRPNNLSIEQWVLLRPDLEEIRKNLRDHPKDWEHIEWYGKTEPDYARSNGRIALFSDLRNGSGNSSVWASLQKALGGLDKPIIRIIGTTFDDVSSGMLIDMVRLTQIVATTELYPIQLWLAGPMSVDWSKRLGERGRLLKPDDQQARTLATLRELERFQQNLPIQYDFVAKSSPQDQLRQVYSFAVVQDVYIFEPKTGSTPEHDSLASMADCLLALFSQKASDDLAGHLGKSRAEANAKTTLKGIGKVSALGSYTIRIPVNPLRRAIAWRMVRECLYDSQVGILPLERLLAQNGEYENFEPGLEDSPNPARIRQALQALMAKYRPHLDTPEFQTVIANEVNRILNGEAEMGDAILQRRGKLEYLATWLDLLQTYLTQGGARNAARKVEELLDQVKAWDTWLRETLYPACQNRFTDARQELKLLLDQPSRQWTLDKALEWEVYKDQIRSWTDRPPQDLSNEALGRLGKRFGWFASYSSSGWRLNLLALPRDFTYEPGANLTAYELPQTPTAFLDPLETIAEPLAQLPLATSALQVAVNYAARELFDQAKPRLEYSDQATIMMGSVSELVLVVAEKSERLQQLEQSLRHIAGMQIRIETAPTMDPTAVTLIRAVDWIPLVTTDLYDENAWAAQTVDPSLYVWRPEQIAAEAEGEERLSSRFVGWLAQDEDLLRGFGLGLIYEAISIPKRGNRWIIPGIGEVFAASAGLALESLFDPTSKPEVLKNERERDDAVHALGEAVAREKQKNSTHPLVYLQEAARRLIPPLKTSINEQDHELAKYMNALIAEEKQS